MIVRYLLTYGGNSSYCSAQFDGVLARLYAGDTSVVDIFFFGRDRWNVLWFW